jgi:tRNA A37 threonylcarbamoyladenosine dehydratase
MRPWELRLSSSVFSELHRHLFPGDGDEHGAVIAVGVADSPRGMRLLARHLFIARDGVDYVPGRHGYRALSADFVARVSHFCAQNRLGYLAVHCHGGRDEVGFSEIDTASHRRGYPALLDIMDGKPVGALVFADNAVAGSIWTRQGIELLAFATVVGLNHRRLYPVLPHHPKIPDEVYNRQSLLFGARGQAILKNAKVCILGLGGVGSLINEWVARLGVGEIVAIDFDRLSPSNRPRLVGAEFWDTADFLLNSRWPRLRRLGEHFSRHKVHIARRVALAANPKIRYDAIVGREIDATIAAKLKDADFLFLCADSMQSRLMLNALVHQYLIPGVQIGSKVSLDPESGDILDVFSVARPVLPEAGGGCLWCNQLISPAKLQEEALSEEQRRRQAYVDDPAIEAPSVITLNALAAAQAANEFLFSIVGLHDQEGMLPGYRMAAPRARRWSKVACASEAACLHCGQSKRSVFARGDDAALPCRASPKN